MKQSSYSHLKSGYLWVTEELAILIFILFLFHVYFFSNCTCTEHFLYMQFESYKMTFQYKFCKTQPQGILVVVLYLK